MCSANDCHCHKIYRVYMCKRLTCIAGTHVRVLFLYVRIWIFFLLEKVLNTANGFMRVCAHDRNVLLYKMIIRLSHWIRCASTHIHEYSHIQIASHRQGTKNNERMCPPHGIQPKLAHWLHSCKFRYVFVLPLCQLKN